MITLRDIGEDALITRIIPLVPLDRSPLAGPGDDCAVIDPGRRRKHLQLLKTDAIVSGVHFTSYAPGRAVGWKAVARVVSDFAAMGGKPERFLITVALPASTGITWVEDLYGGIGDCIAAFDATLAGGETSSVPEGSSLVISVAATGSVPRDHLLLRSTGRPGDVLLVTGTLGGSLTGKHQDFIPRTSEAEWLARHYKPTAMMDLSDGLAKDLPRLAAASRCGFELDLPALPLTSGCTTQQALTDGEDYELLFSVAPERVPALLADWKPTFSWLPLTVIGRLVPEGTGDSLSGGWDHFAPLSNDPPAV